MYGLAVEEQHVARGRRLVMQPSTSLARQWIVQDETKAWIDRDALRNAIAAWPDEDRRVATVAVWLLEGEAVDPGEALTGLSERSASQVAMALGIASTPEPATDH